MLHFIGTFAVYMTIWTCLFSPQYMIRKTKRKVNYTNSNNKKVCKESYGKAGLKIFLPSASILSFSVRFKLRLKLILFKMFTEKFKIKGSL